MKLYFKLTSLEMAVMLGYAKKYAESIGFNKIDKSSWKTFVKYVERGNYKDLVQLFENLRQVEDWGCNGRKSSFSLGHYQTPTDTVFLDVDEYLESIEFFYSILSNNIEFDKKFKKAGDEMFVEVFEEYFRKACEDPIFLSTRTFSSPLKVAFALLFYTKNFKTIEGFNKEKFDAVLSEARHIKFDTYSLLKKAMLGNSGYSFLVLKVHIKGLDNPTYAIFLNAKGSIRNISSYFYNGGRKESMLFGYNGFYEADTEKVHPSLVSSSQFSWENSQGIVEKLGRRIFGDIKLNPNVINLDHYSFNEEVLAPSILIGGVK